MASDALVKEFGFPGAAQFPRPLIHHAVTLTLPDAAERGIPPVNVEIDDGLLVPSQDGDAARGMIIRHDGTMLHVGHADQGNPVSALEVNFVNEIPFDVRIVVQDIMVRAVLADPSLQGIWNRVTGAWSQRFPPDRVEIIPHAVAEAATPSGIWDTIAASVTRQVETQSRGPFRVVVQEEAELFRGWQGREWAVDEISVETVRRGGVENYLRGRLLGRLKDVLREPLFNPRARFRLMLEPRSCPTFKLLLLPPEPGR